MTAFIAAAWRSGLRGRSFQAVFFLGLILLAVAYLAASFSPRAPKTVALDVGMAGIRFTLVLAILFWIQDLLGKEIERKLVFFALTYPVPRWQYLLARYISVVTMALPVVLILGLGLQGVVALAGGDYVQSTPVHMGLPFWTTLIFLWLGICVVAAFTVLVASLSTTPLLSFSLGAAFAIASFAIGPVVAYLQAGASGQEGLVEHYLPILSLVQWLVPDLGRLDLRTWPMYGVPVSSEILVAGTGLALGFVGVALGLAMRIFSRREFS